MGSLIVGRAEAKSSGLNRYFLGTPCINSHVAERYIDGHCVECARIKRNTKHYKTAQKAAAAKWWKSNSGKAARARYEQKQSVKEYRINYRKTPEHKAAIRKCNHDRRAKPLEISAAFTKQDEQKLRNYQSTCHICQKAFRRNDPAELDHVVALSTGGAHESSNIALAHRSCNRRKHNERTHLI